MADHSCDAWIEFNPAEPFSNADSAFVASITAVHGVIPNAKGDVVTIKTGNGLGGPLFSGDINTIGIIAIYDPKEDDYHCIQLSCPSA